MLKKIAGIVSLLLVAFILAGCGFLNNSANINNEATDISGKELLFVKQGQIYAGDQDAKQIINITQNNKNNFSPLWVAKGSEIIYISEESGYYEVWQKNIATNEAVLLWGSKKKPNFINLSPDRYWLIYAEDKACFLLNRENKEAQRISDDCDSVVWAPNDKRFAYSTQDKLYWRDFNVKMELGQAQEIYSGIIKGPVFLDDKTLIFETADQDTDPASFDIYKLSLADNNLSPLTDLNFSAHENVVLQLSPDSKKIMYYFDNAVWLINLSDPNLAKEVIQDAHDIIWNENSDGFYYVIKEVDENNEMVHNIYRATKDGLNKEKIAASADSPIFFHNLKSQSQ